MRTTCKKQTAGCLALLLLTSAALIACGSDAEQTQQTTPAVTETAAQTEAAAEDNRPSLELPEMAEEEA